MNRLIVATVAAALVVGASRAPAQYGPRAVTEHPAVVRVVVPEQGAMAYGSGALVAVRGDHGLVLTNWHVIRGASGSIHVHFPDGFYSLAVVVAADRDWDLAALRIAKPHVRPIPLASRAPRPGEPLTIAGYGSGQYRTATGRCTQYVSPGTNLPFEMVELAAGARQGDSGGPILNHRGELAGVLFGSALGRTTGSYCGRVHRFLAGLPANVLPDVRQDPAMIAQHDSASYERRPSQRTNPSRHQMSGENTAIPSQAPTAAIGIPRPPGESSAWPGAAAGAAPPTWQPDSATPCRPGPGSSRADNDLPQVGPDYPGAGYPPVVRDENKPADSGRDGWVASSKPANGPHGPGQGSQGAGNRPNDEPTPFDQVRTVLAAIGFFALVFHGLRVLSLADGS